MKRIILAIIIFTAISLVPACSGPSEPTPVPTEKPSPSPTATATSTPVPTSTPTLTPTFTPTPEPTPTRGPLSAKEIFDEVGPSVVFIETSGLLINGKYIVTNAHVVWPFEKVRVVFPDGSEFEDVPVTNRDLLGDLAILGPVESNAEPLSLVDREDLAIGSEVYLIGYPGEVEEFPEPTITRGLISRIREWDTAGITFFQTDATIGGGQSGGVLVTEDGEVIGISGLSFGEAEFGLVASAADLTERIEQLIDGKDISKLGQRQIPTDGGAALQEHLSFDHEWDSIVFVVNEPEATDIEVEANSDSTDLGIYVNDAGGYYVAHADDTTRGRETTQFTTEFEAPYFISLNGFLNYSDLEIVTVGANRKLIPLTDLDDGRGIGPEQSFLGSLDYPGDLDYFNLLLDEGAEVNILVDSIMLDPHLMITRSGYTDEQILQDNDTGGGVFGLNSEMTFIAADPGIYLLIVQDALGYNVGGYSVRIRESYEAGPTPMAHRPTPVPRATGFGSTQVYRSDFGSFSFEFPSEFSDDPSLLAQFADFCQMTTACYIGETLLGVAEEDLSILGTTTLEEYVDFYITGTAPFGIEVISRDEFTTDSGLTGIVLSLDFGGALGFKRFMYVHEYQAFSITYIVNDDLSTEMLQAIDDSFASFDIG